MSNPNPLNAANAAQFFERELNRKPLDLDRATSGVLHRLGRDVGRSQVTPAQLYTSTVGANYGNRRTHQQLYQPQLTRSLANWAQPYQLLQD